MGSLEDSLVHKWQHLCKKKDIQDNCHSVVQVNHYDCTSIQ